MSEARKDKRSLLSLKIRYKSATLEDFIEHYSGDISRGGIFIKSKKPLTVGTLLKFEFLLEDQSPLIHGVGRVVWRRDPSTASPGEPPGMGIKFIKMDPQCRAVVQGIVEKRKEPGAFERGNEGAPTGVMSAASLKETSTNPDRTSVRHVSEFLASAMSEGDATPSTKREAEAGAERAREASRNLAAEKREAVARGALRARGASLNPDRSAQRKSSGNTASSAFGARPGRGMDAQQTLPQGFETKSFDAEATIVNQAMDPDLMAELRGALAKSKKNSDTAHTMPPRATPVVPSDPEAIGAAAESLWPAPSPPMPAIPAPGAAVPTRPVLAQSGLSADPSAEDQTGPIELVSLAPSSTADISLAPSEPGEESRRAILEAFTEVPESTPEAENNPLAQLHDGPTTSEVDKVDAPKKKSGGKGLAVGLLVLLVAGAAAAAWQMGLLPLGSPGAEGSETAEASETAAVAEPADPQALSPADPEPSSPAPTEAEDGSETLELAEQEPAEQQAVALPYVIQIVTRPSGALVKANESLSTRTPGEIRFESKPSAVTLLIRKQGYRSKRVRVDLSRFVTEADRHVLELEERLLRQPKKATPEPAEDALDQLATAAAETAAAQADTPAAEPETSTEREATPAAKQAAPEPEAAKPVETAPEPEAAKPAPKEPSASAPVQEPAAKAASEKPSSSAPAPASETGAAAVAP